MKTNEIYSEPVCPNANATPHKPTVKELCAEIEDLNARVRFIEGETRRHWRMIGFLFFGVAVLGILSGFRF